MKFIDDAHKKFSVWAASAFAVVGFAYEYFPDFQTYLPSGWAKYAFAFVLFVRIIKQQPRP